MRRPLISWLLVGSIVLASFTVVALAGDETKPTKPAKVATSKPPTVKPEAEAQAMALVREHLPELAEVLEPLKATNPGEYRKAITDLATEARTQTDIRAKNPARADLALAAWQAQTRVELIAAQLANTPSAERASQLHAAIEARVAVDIRRHQFEADQAEAAVARARENLARAEANRDRTHDTLLRSEKNREAKVENRYRALLPKPKPASPTVTKPKTTPRSTNGTVPLPSPLPATSLNPVPLPSPRSQVEGNRR